MEQVFSEDHLLGRKILLRQPKIGYRVAIDPIFLAASVQAEPRETILDVGAGVGAASLCLAVRCPNVKVIGIELYRKSIRYAVDNIQLNNLKDRVEILHGDLLMPPPRLAAGTFSHVISNPPYLEFSRHNISPYESKAGSNTEGEATFSQWVKFCLLMVKPKGTVTLIHRAEYLDKVISILTGNLGNITVYPLWAGLNKSAKRFLIRGVKNANGSCTLLSGMVLHQPHGQYTHEAEKILRHGEGIKW